MSVGKNIHPYFPRTLKLPNYQPNENSIVELLGIFFTFITIVIILTFWYAGTKSHLKGRFIVKSKICWFVSCAFIHIILEGYFSIFYKSLVGEQTYLAQMWKEYGKGDSRYVSQDTFTVCMETITAFVDGPFAACAAYTFLVKSPTRHLFQILLSLCQLYGDVLYLSTEAKDGFIHSELYHPLYFWFYFIFLNLLWIVIPLLCILESCSALSNAQCICDLNAQKSSKKAK